MTQDNLSTKLCECGCGQRTPIAKRTRRDIGHVRGQPVRFALGHNASIGEGRWCYGCKEWLSREHFDPIIDRRGTRRGLQQRCRSCRERIRYRNSPEVIADRFWSKVDRSGGQNACWIWTAGKTNGYGSFSVGGRNHTAQRVAWALTKGPIPVGMALCHNCPEGDNPECVNPAHLFLGTAIQNVEDRIAKGRTRTGHLLGEDHPLSKLTADAVREIRACGDSWEATVLMAERHGVTTTAIRDVQKRKTWRHVD